MKVFLIIYLIICSVSNASLKDNLDYLKNKKIINESSYEELNDKENISKEAIIESLSNIIKILEEKRDKNLEDIRVVKNLLSTIFPEVIKNTMNISEYTKRLEKLEREYERDIKVRIKYLESSKNALNFGFETKVCQNINLLSRYEDSSSFLPPLFHFTLPILDFTFIMNSNMIKGLTLKTNFFLSNDILRLKEFEMELTKNFIYLSLFKNKFKLPSLLDFLNIYDAEEFFLENGLIFNINLYTSDTFNSRISAVGEVSDLPDYLYYIKLNNNLSSNSKTNNTNPFLNFSYIERGTNKDKDDKTFKGFMILETGINISNDIFKIFDLNIEYSKLVGDNIVEGLVTSEFMRSIPLFKIENRDALYLYSKLQLQALKLLKISFGLYESGKKFDTKILGDKYKDPISRTLVLKKKLIFRESDIIEYTNGAGLFGRVALGEGYNYSLSLTYSYFEDEFEALNKLGFDSLLRFLPFNLYSEISLYKIDNPLIKIEEIFTLSNLFDLEARALLTRDFSLDSNNDPKFNLGLSSDLNLPIDIHNLLIGITYLNQGILINKEINSNGKSSFSTIVGYENYDISNWISKGYFSDISVKTSLSYLYNLNKSKLKSSHEFQFSLSSYISDFLTEKLAFTPSVALSNRDNKWYPGLNLKMSYLINNNCTLVSSLGNMFEIEKSYFIEKKEKMKINLPLNRLNYDFNDWFIKLEFELKI